MPVELIPISGLEDTGQTVYPVRALAIDGRSLVLAALAQWAKDDPGEHKKIMASMRYASTTRRPWPVQGLVRKNGVDEPRHPRGAAGDFDIYEFKARAGKARLLFYCSPGGRETLVVLCDFWKNRDRDPEQAAAFRRAQGIRNKVFADVKRLLGTP